MADSNQRIEKMKALILGDGNQYLTGTFSKPDDSREEPESTVVMLSYLEYVIRGLADGGNPSAELLADIAAIKDELDKLIALDIGNKITKVEANEIINKLDQLNAIPYDEYATKNELAPIRETLNILQQRTFEKYDQRGDVANLDNRLKLLEDLDFSKLSNLDMIQDIIDDINDLKTFDPAVINTINNRIDSLNQSIQNILSNDFSKYDNYDQRITENKQRIDLLESKDGSKIESNFNQINVLKNSLSLLENRIPNDLVQVVHLDNLRNALQGEIDQNKALVDQQITVLKGRVKDLEDKPTVPADLTAKVDKLVTDLQTLSDSVGQYDDTNLISQVETNLNNFINNLNNHVDTTQTVSDIKTRLTDLENDTNGVGTKVTNLIAQVNDLENKDVELSTKISSIETSISDLESAMQSDYVSKTTFDTLNSLVTTIKTDLDVIKAIDFDSFADKDQTQQAIDALVQRVNTLENGDFATKTELNTLENDYNSHKTTSTNKISNLESLTGDLRTDVDENGNKITALENKTYKASEIDNDSVVQGAKVSDALTLLMNTAMSGLRLIGPLITNLVNFPLQSGVGTNGDTYWVVSGGQLATPLDNIQELSVGDFVFFAQNEWHRVGRTDEVTSFNGRKGAVVPEPTDYAASTVTNNSRVDGNFVSDALNWLADELESRISTAEAAAVALEVRVAANELAITNLVDEDNQLKTKIEANRLKADATDQRLVNLEGENIVVRVEALEGLGIETRLESLEDIDVSKFETKTEHNATKTRVTDLENLATQAQAQAVVFGQRLTDTENLSNQNKADIDNLKSVDMSVYAKQADLDDANQEIGTNKLAIADKAEQSALDATNTKVATLETDNTQNKTDIADHEARIADIESKDFTDQADHDALENRVKTIEDLDPANMAKQSDLDNLTSRTDGIETKTNSNETKIGTLETDNASTKTRLTDAEDDINDLKNQKADVNHTHTSNEVANLSSLPGATLTEVLNSIVDNVTRGMEFRGVYNADTNTPSITSGSGSDRDYYLVNVSKLVLTTPIDGITELYAGDSLIFWNGKWERIGRTDAITSVFGRTGNIVAQSGDYDSDLIENKSDVTAATVTAALNKLKTDLDTATGGTGNSISAIIARLDDLEAEDTNINGLITAARNQAQANADIISNDLTPGIADNATQIAAIKTNIASIVSDISTINTDIQGLATKAELKVESDRLDVIGPKVTQNETDIAGLKTENTSNKNRLDSLETLTQTTKAVADNAETIAENNEADIVGMKADITALKAKPTFDPAVQATMQQEINQNKSDVADQETRLDGHDADIASKASNAALGALTTRVENNENNKATKATTDALDGRLTTLEAIDHSVYAEKSTVNAVSSKADQNEADISSLNTNKADANHTHTFNSDDIGNESSVAGATVTEALDKTIALSKTVATGGYIEDLPVKKMTSIQYRTISENELDISGQVTLNDKENVIMRKMTGPVEFVIDSNLFSNNPSIWSNHDYAAEMHLGSAPSTTETSISCVIVMIIDNTDNYSVKWNVESGIKVNTKNGDTPQIKGKCRVILQCFEDKNNNRTIYMNVVDNEIKEMAPYLEVKKFLNEKDGIIRYPLTTDSVFALGKNDKVYTWGANSVGGLGLGDTNYHPLTEFPLPPGKEVAKIISGNVNNFFLMTDGSVFVSGQNTYGQKGLGNNSPNNSLAEITELSGKNIIDIYVSKGASYQNVVFIEDNGTAYTCGHNGGGNQLARTATTPYEPKPISGSDWKKCWMGSNAGMGGGYTNSGDLYSWGYSANSVVGALGQTPGNPNDVSSQLPAKIKHSSPTLEDGTSSHLVVVLADGTVHGIGTNGEGQLGLGNNTNMTSFTAVPLLGSDNEEVYCFGTAGYSLTIVRKTNGSLFSMGANRRGQAGNNSPTNTNVNIPTRIGNIDNTYRNGVKEIAVSNSSTTHGLSFVIVFNDGAVEVFGKNGWGNFGTGDTTDVLEPTQLNFPEKIISASWYGTAHTGGFYYLGESGKLYMSGNYSPGFQPQKPDLTINTATGFIEMKPWL